MDLNNEVWKDIPNYEGLYQASNLGRIKSLEKKRYTGKDGKCIRVYPEKILKPTTSSNRGYMMVTLMNFGNPRYYTLHKLIALTFLENIENKPYVNHIDNNKYNNYVSNLEWVSERENNCHASKIKTSSSKYVGVHFYKNKWKSQISINGKKVHLGTFTTEEEAYNSRVNFEKNKKIENKYL